METVSGNLKGRIDGGNGGELVHEGGAGGMVGGDEAGVDVEGDGRARVAKGMGHFDEGNAMHEHEGGGGVAQVVEADMRKADAGGQAGKFFGEVIAVLRLAQ